MLRKVSLLVLLVVPAFAQAQDGPTQGLTPKCVDVMLMPTSNVERKDLFTDADGDKWITLRDRGSGKITTGYVSMRFQKYCVVGEGKVNPES